MQNILNPNIPLCNAGAVIVDGRIAERLENSLVSRHIELIKTERYPGIYEAISYHPDIMLHHLGGHEIVYAPGVDERVLLKLKSRGFRLIAGATRLMPAYPGNIAYNVARVGNLAFHNTKYTDPVLVDELCKRGVRLVHVKQGYTKCSTCVVNESSIITSDAGIAKAAENTGLNVLLIEQQTKIRLTGLDYGFIGGSTGLISNNELAFAGNIKKLDACEVIRDFLAVQNIKIVSLSESEVEDIGSIIPLQIL